jgi:hypothetical protein
MTWTDTRAINLSGSGGGFLGSDQLGDLANGNGLSLLQISCDIRSQGTLVLT